MNQRAMVLDPEERDRLVDDFRTGLERAAKNCESYGLRDGNSVDAAQTVVDLATLLSEMAVLKNELRLQSRQFKNTLEELRLFGNDLRQHGERLQRDLDRAREQAASVQGQTERQFLLALLDLRDRLQSGVDAAGRVPSSFLTRLVPAPTRFAASLAEGQRLTLQRLDDLLASHGVRSLQVLGEALDPHRMRVVGVEAASEATNVADGTVLREVQRGFLHEGELLRVAQVIVSRKETRT
ncbi:MAG: nucleotide exchange factor GrpE [Candidatus Accumulibacter sp.]|nr:nucleotide exchange factor GrpE [Accumulibacter sp.]